MFEGLNEITQQYRFNWPLDTTLGLRRERGCRVDAVLSITSVTGLVLVRDSGRFGQKLVQFCTSLLWLVVCWNIISAFSYICAGQCEGWRKISVFLHICAVSCGLMEKISAFFVHSMLDSVRGGEKIVHFCTTVLWLVVYWNKISAFVHICAGRLWRVVSSRKISALLYMCARVSFLFVRELLVFHDGFRRIVGRSQGCFSSFLRFSEILVAERHE